MPNQSLKSRLHSFILRNYPRLVPSGELQRLAMDAGYSAQNAGRRLRELENAKKIEVFYQRGCAVYQAKQEYVDSPELAPKETKEPNSLFGPPNSPKAVNPQNIICGKLK